jgi:hypothetical protein
MLKSTPGLRTSIFVTRESEMDSATRAYVHDKSISEALSSSSQHGDLMQLLVTDCPRFSVAFLNDHHPAVAEIVESFMERAAILGESIDIVVSGPEELGSDLRASVVTIRTSKALQFYWDARV